MYDDKEYTDGAPIIPRGLAQSANGRSEMINFATGTKKCKEENDKVFERLWNWALDLCLPIDLHSKFCFLNLSVEIIFYILSL